MFNAERFVAAALTSLLVQSFTDFRLLISDNASTDGTREIIKELTKGDSRVEYTRNAENVGALANFGAVFEKADSPYFMWAAADDLWEPGFVQSMVANLREDARRTLSFCAYDTVDDDTRPIRVYERHARLAVPTGRLGRLHQLLWFPEEYGKASLIYGLMVTESARRVGGVRTYSANQAGLDHLMVFRLAGEGPIAVAPSVLYHKRHLIQRDRRWSRANQLAARFPQIDPVPRTYLEDYRRLLPRIPLTARERLVLRVSLEVRIAWNDALHLAKRSYQVARK